MLSHIRRFVLLATAAAWQGGFVFYAGVVVPTGTELHGHFTQGLLTQRVTNWLNLLGLACHGAYFWELMATTDRRRWEWASWGASLTMLGGLSLIHLKMDTLIDPVAGQVGDGFRVWHMAYLWLSTLQWVIAGVLGWVTVSTSREPRASG